jgi:hypothetical protein
MTTQQLPLSIALPTTLYDRRYGGRRRLQTAIIHSSSTATSDEHYYCLVNGIIIARIFSRAVVDVIAGHLFAVVWSQPPNPLKARHCDNNDPPKPRPWKDLFFSFPACASIIQPPHYLLPTT